jgi:2,4-dichlorophenol 6-monooxygenase
MAWTTEDAGELPHESTPVLIVGAGPAGLTTALSLARQGIRSVVLTRYPGLAHSPRAHIVNQRTLEILADLGLSDELAAVGDLLEEMPNNCFVMSLAGPELARTTAWGAGVKDVSRYRSASPHLPLNLPQHRLEPVLAAAARSTGLVDLRFATEYLSLRQHDGGVSALVRDLTTSRESVIDARYLVGADGGHSRVLEDVGLSVRGETDMAAVAFAWVRADVSAYTAYRPGALYWSADGINFGTWILVSKWDEWVVGWGVDPSSFDRDEAAIIEQIRKFAGNRHLEVEVKSVSMWGLNHAAADVYTAGRVFCMGDAVHRHPPANGLGSNTSIADGYNLAWKLAYVLKGWAGEGLLDTYTVERAPVGRQVVDRAWKSTTEIFRAGAVAGMTEDMSEARKWAVLESLGDDTDEAAGRRAAIEEFVESLEYHFNAHGVELGYRYGGPGIVSDDGDLPDLRTADELIYVASTSPGEHVPHANIEHNQRRLSTLDLVGHGQLTLLTGRAGAGWEAAAEEVRRLLGVPIDTCVIGTTHAYHDPLGEWERVRQVDDDGCILVRPDGHVAWRSRTGRDTHRLIEVVRHILDRPLMRPGSGEGDESSLPVGTASRGPLSRRHDSFAKLELLDLAGGAHGQL